MVGSTRTVSKGNVDLPDSFPKRFCNARGSGWHNPICDDDDVTHLRRLEYLSKGHVLLYFYGDVCGVVFVKSTQGAPRSRRDPR